MAEPGIFAEFFKHPLLMTHKSNEAGRPIYEDFDFVRIKVAGVEKDLVERKATNLDKERFAEEWAKYQAGEKQESGTRIEFWPALTPAMVKNLQAFNIYTVEAMANLSDAGCMKIMGAYKLREDARKYLDNGSEAAELRKMAENQAKVIDQQGKELAELRAMVESLSQPKDADPSRVPESQTITAKGARKQ